MSEKMVQCPFCKEPGFDLTGLKLHFQMGWCDPYNEIRTTAIEGDPLRHDHRKPEECERHLIDDTYNPGKEYCKMLDPFTPIIHNGIKQKICPCAAWEKKK